MSVFTLRLTPMRVMGLAHEAQILFPRRVVFSGCYLGFFSIGFVRPVFPVDFGSFPILYFLLVLYSLRSEISVNNFTLT
jgi:hypothetical protein